MTVTIRYFAVLRDRRGLSVETVETQAATVGDLKRDLITRHRLGLAEALIRTAVAHAFVEDDTALTDGMEVVLIPPVAGG